MLFQSLLEFFYLDNLMPIIFCKINKKYFVDFLTNNWIIGKNANNAENTEKSIKSARKISGFSPINPWLFIKKKKTKAETSPAQILAMICRKDLFIFPTIAKPDAINPN